MSANEQSAPDVIALRPFLPAKDFETSLRFYTELGFRPLRLGPPLASMHLGPFAFLLQANDDPNAAHNLVMHLLVSDVAAWWARIARLDLDARYGVQAPRAPTLEPWGFTVSYIWDPSGVLWHIAEEARDGQKPAEKKAQSMRGRWRGPVFWRRAVDLGGGLRRTTR